MTATFTVQGANLQIQFTYVALTAKMTDIATNAAHRLWSPSASMGQTPPTFESLTNTEKLAILDAYIVKQFTQLAKEYFLSTAIDAAIASVRATADANYSI